MIGLVLVTHGQLGHALCAALEHVTGAQMQLRAIAIGAEDDMEHRRTELREAIEQMDSGQGMVLLTDLYGGSPSNLAFAEYRESHVEVVAGVNLPLLVKLVEVRKELPLGAAVTAALQAGQKYMYVASAVPPALRRAHGGQL